MLLTLVCAVTVATVVVLAAHAARDRRTLSSEIRALRDEVQELTRLVQHGAAGGDADAPTLSDGGVEPVPSSESVGAQPEPTPAADAPAAQPGRGSRTVH